MVETMQILQDEQKIRTIEFFSTHPEPENRMSYIMQKIQTKYHNLSDLKIGREDYRRFILEQLKK
jgi:predicted Zn-dependent protease